MRIEPVGSTTWTARPFEATLVVQPAEGTSLLPPRPGRDEHPSSSGHRRRPADSYDGSAGDGSGHGSSDDVRDGELLPDMTVAQFEALLRGVRTDVRHPDAGQRYGADRRIIDLTEQRHTIDLRA